MNFELIFKEDADKNLIFLENLNLKKFYKKYNIYNYPKNKLDTMLYLEERNLNLEKSNNSKIRYISGGGDYTLEVFKIEKNFLLFRTSSISKVSSVPLSTFNIKLELFKHGKRPILFIF